VIVVPFLNWPAFRASRWTSPIDGGNMNRSFPGRPDGTPTEKLADFVTRHLLPLADIVLDFHSGGRTLDFLPFAACHRLDDAALEQRAMAAVGALAAPWSVFMREIDAAGMLDTTAESMGRVFVTTELGGGGTARPETVAIAERGVHNLLVHAGILDAEPRPAPTTVLEMPDDAFLFAEDDGMVEPLVPLGAEVRRGDPVVRLHDFRRTGTEPVEYRAPLDGLLLARHFPGLAAAGDCLAVFARPAG
jgi:N-alpha-acetyl-L-2,4-diaminobutyrate deacetylase